MGLFQSIGDLANPRFQRSRRKLERAQINAQIQGILKQQEWRKQEDPREQAHLKQSSWARGLGKSSIAEQDMSRLKSMQDMRNAGLASALHVAARQKTYIKKKHKHERVSMWLGLLDGIVGLAAGAGGGSRTSALGMGESTGTDFGMASGWGTDYTY